MYTKLPVGTSSENDQLNLDAGYITIDTERKAIRLFDGVTQGGFEVVGQQAWIPPVPLGEHWELLTSPTSSMIKSVIFFKGYFYLFPFNSTTVYRSINGDSWGSITLPVAMNSEVVVSGDNAVMGFINTTTHEYVYTRNGTTWINDASFTYERLTAAGSNNNQISMVTLRGSGTRPTVGNAYSGRFFTGSSSGTVSSFSKTNSADAIRKMSRSANGNANTRCLAIVSRDTNFSYPSMLRYNSNLQSNPEAVAMASADIVALGYIYDIYAYSSYFYLTAGVGKVARMQTGGSAYTLYDVEGAVSAIMGFCDAESKLYTFARNYVGYSTNNGASWTKASGVDNLNKTPRSMAFGNNTLICGGDSGLLIKSVETPGGSAS